LLAVNLVGRSAVIDFDLGFDRIHGVEVNGTGNLESWGARIQRLVRGFYCWPVAVVISGGRATTYPGQRLRIRCKRA
jgi:hypothetical protein